MSENKFAILFEVNNFPVKVEPKNSVRFSVDELYSLLKAQDDQDLDRIEVFNGALYCLEIRTNLKLNNSASQFWFNNAPHMDRDGIVGHALFIPTDQDVYTGSDSYHT